MNDKLIEEYRVKLDEIQNLWEKDCDIDGNRLDANAIEIAKLHSKYYKIYSQEKMILRKYEADLKILKLEKYEFYDQGPTKETEQKGWKLPAKGRLLKNEIQMYMEGDKEIINQTLKIALQNEKVDFLDSCIKSLNSRGFNIRAAIDFLKFQAGN